MLRNSTNVLKKMFTHLMYLMYYITPLYNAKKKQQ